MRRIFAGSWVDEMDGVQAKNLTTVLRKLQAEERERIDRYFEVIETAVTAMVDDEDCRRPTPAQSPEHQLLSRALLAKRLGISSRTISELLSEGLPCVRFGKRVQFDYEDVVAWAKARTVTCPKRRLRIVK